MDVALAGLNPQQRLFFVVLLRASAQIAIQLVAQKLLHRVGAVGFFHDHERGVLGESFDDCGLAFGVGAYYLMSPPLMANLMRGDEEGQVDRVFLVGIDPGDEADALGKRDRVGKRLGKVGHSGKLNNAGFFVLVGPKVLDVVIQGLLHGVDHPGNVPGLLLEVVDFQLDAVPLLARHFIAAGSEAVKIHRWMVEFVFEVAAAILLPFANQ